MVWFWYKVVQNVFLLVENYKVFMFKEVDYFFDVVNEDEMVWLVYCGVGKGRVGMFFVCYIVMYGFQKLVVVLFGVKLVFDGGIVIWWLCVIWLGFIEIVE